MYIYQFYQEILGQHNKYHFVEIAGHFSSCLFDRKYAQLRHIMVIRNFVPSFGMGIPGNERSYWSRWTRITSLLMQE